MGDLVLFLKVLGLLLLIIGLLHVTAHWLGLGRCKTCSKIIPPWDAYCRTHQLDAPDQPFLED